MKALLLIVIYKGLMPIFLKLIGVKFIHQKGFLPTGPCLIVANHNSHIDTMALLSCIPAKDLIKTHPVAAQSYFGKNQYLAKVSSLFVNTVLIRRKEEGGNSSALLALEKQLRKGHNLILYPEGSRGEPGKMQAFRKGIAVLLQKHPQIPYLPVYIEGTGHILPKGKLLLVPHQAKVIIGAPKYIKSNEIASILGEVKTAILALHK